MNETMFILTMFRHGFKVRWTTAYFVLIGKKTGSILSYAASYQLLPYYHLFPEWSKDDFRQIIQSLVEAGDLTCEDVWAQITSQGQQKLQDVDESLLADLDGWNYGAISQSMWQRFLFVNQVISELSHHEKHYLPLETNLQAQWTVKQQLTQIQLPTDQWIPQYGQALLDFLMTRPVEQAQWVTNQLTGYQSIGMTFDQACLEADISPFMGQLWKMTTVHQLLKSLQTQTAPYLAHFYYYERPLADNVVKVGNLMANGCFSIPDIAHDLHKKEGTIVDYLIELAITSPLTFPFSAYIGSYEETLAQYEMTHPNVGSWVYQELLTEIGEIPFVAVRLYQIRKGLLHAS